ncbi:tunicamycin resistance protein [Deinococcus xinjiangensis]|uniref:Tunicamycin resistance protein n=2 Tax=Deinococcus xinjiangensis TaxID=457454 RepID=A0ABP9VAC4_9DEIO
MTTAQALQERLNGSFIFDPEEMGAALKKLTPKFSGESQSHPMWIPLMLDALQYAIKEADGPLIVPVTIADLSRHRRLMSGLQARGMNVQHFTLLASKDAVQAGLRRRNENYTMWDADELEQRLSDFQGEQFKTHINIGDHSPHAIADIIAEHAGLTLRPAPSDPLRWLRTTFGGRR